MKSLLLLIAGLAAVMVIYGILLFRARYRRLKRIAKSNQVEILAAKLIAQEQKTEDRRQKTSDFAEASSDGEDRR